MYGILRVCVMHIYLQRSNNSLQAMEMYGNFYPHLEQKWVVKEYYFHSLEYYLYSYKGSIPLGGAKWVTLPYIWDQLQGIM